MKTKEGGGQRPFLKRSSGLRVSIDDFLENRQRNRRGIYVCKEVNKNSVTTYTLVHT